MDCGARGLAVAAVMSELAVRAAEPATPLSEALIPPHLRCLRVGLPAVRGDEFDRSTVLLLYVGPRSCRADVLTPDGRSSVEKPRPGRREPLGPFVFAADPRVGGLCKT